MREFLRLKDLMYAETQIIDRQHGHQPFSIIDEKSLIFFIADDMDNDENRLLHKYEQEFVLCHPQCISNRHIMCDVCKFESLMVFERYLRVRSVKRFLKREFSKLRLKFFFNLWMNF